MAKSVMVGCPLETNLLFRSNTRQLHESILCMRLSTNVNMQSLISVWYKLNEKIQLLFDLDIMLRSLKLVWECNAQWMLSSCNVWKTLLSLWEKVHVKVSNSLIIHYIGSLLTSQNANWKLMAHYHNQNKKRKRWGCVGRQNKNKTKTK